MLIDDGKAWVCRVEYDVEAEVKLLRARGVPHGDWVARQLRAAAALPLG